MPRAHKSELVTKPDRGQRPIHLLRFEICHINVGSTKMADQLLKRVQDLFEGQIVIRLASSTSVQTANETKDFEGQKEAEIISTCLLAFFGVCFSKSLFFYK